MPPAAAVARAAREPQAWAYETQGGLAAALGLAAVALARLTTGRSCDGDDASSSSSSGGGGGGGGGGNGGSSNGGNGGSSENTEPSEAESAAFAASLAAAQALLANVLLDSYSDAHGNSPKQNAAIAEAIAAPLWYGSAFIEQQQQHLQHIGNAAERATSDFTEAFMLGALKTPVAAPAAGGGGGSGSTDAAATAGVSSGAAGGSLAAGSAAAGGGSIRTRRPMDLPSAATRMHRVTQALPHIVTVMGDSKASELAAWAAWQPWSEAIASCFQLLAPVDLTATDAGPIPVGKAVRGATTDLLTAAQFILAVASARGVRALQKQPAPALLAAVAAAACEPLADGSPAEQRRKKEAHSAAYIALMAVADALAASPSPPPPPLSPHLLRSACAVLMAHLGEPLQGLGWATSAWGACRAQTVIHAVEKLVVAGTAFDVLCHGCPMKCCTASFESCHD